MKKTFFLILIAVFSSHITWAGLVKKNPANKMVAKSLTPTHIVVAQTDGKTIQIPRSYFPNQKIIPQSSYLYVYNN